MNTNDNTVALGNLIAFLESNQQAHPWLVNTDISWIGDMFSADIDQCGDDPDPEQDRIGAFDTREQAELVCALVNGIPDLLTYLKDLKRRMDADQPLLLDVQPKGNNDGT